jgi:hypothetical protein
MKTRLSHTIYLAFALAVIGVCAGAETPKPPAHSPKSGPASSHAFTKEIGDLEARYDRAAWQSPELTLQGLRSDNDETRLKAFRLLGATDDDSHETQYGLNGEAILVATPWKSELLYASLGEDSTQQAVIAVQVRNLVLVAVAMASGKDWQRIAAFRSLYPPDRTLYFYGSALTGGNILANTVEIGSVPDRGYEHAELILRAIDVPLRNQALYIEYEAHFRLQGTELRRVIAFKSRVRSCGGPRQAEVEPSPATGSCSIERRWFYRYALPWPLENAADAIVAEARGEFPNPGPTNDPFDTDLESRYLRPFSCEALKFSERTHQYEPVSVPFKKLSIPICESASYRGGREFRPWK